MLTVCGWPRSGTHLLKALLEQATGQSVVHSHAIPDDVSDCVFIIRDPRDAFASHWMLYNETHAEKRGQIEHLHSFFAGRDMEQPYFKIGWAVHTAKVLNVAAIQTRHEWVMANPKAEIYRLADALGIWPADVDTSIVGSMRCDPSDLPATDMGKVGKWVDVLEPATVAELWRYCGTVAEMAEYTNGLYL